MQAIAEANKKLARQVEGVVVTQRKVIAKVNVLGRQQAKIVGTLNEVIKQQEIQMTEIRKLHQLEKVVQYNHAAIRFTLLLDQIEDSVDRYEEALAQA